MQYQRLMAVDPSLTCSGWAMLDVSGRGGVQAVGKIRSLPASHPFAERILDVQQKISQVFDQFELGGGDVLICEAPTTMRDPRAAFQVEQVRVIFETLARARGAFVPGRLNPRSVQYEIMGLKGKQLDRAIVKHTALETARALYRCDLERLGFVADVTALKKHQDIVDALLIGSLGRTRIEAAHNSGISLAVLLEQNGNNSRRSLKVSGG